jgi:hypothetical protein
MRAQLLHQVRWKATRRCDGLRLMRTTRLAENDAPSMAADSSVKSKRKCSSFERQRVSTQLWKFSDRNQPPAEGRHRMLPSWCAVGWRRGLSPFVASACIASLVSCSFFESKLSESKQRLAASGEDASGEALLALRLRRVLLHCST